MIKNMIVFILGILLISCSSSSDSDPIDQKDDDTVTTPTESEKPIAMDDTVTTVEDSENTIFGFLDNDTLVTGTTITSFDETTVEGGYITDNRNGTYIYEPPQSFAGQDSFSYTICDRATIPNCSTATVTLVVEDEGSPSAVDDSFKAAKNNTLVITTMFDNDNLLDNTSFSSINDENTLGTAILKVDGKIDYVPPADFIGTDSFTYTICDDDSQPTCSTATITVEILETINFNIPNDLLYYYTDLAFTENNEVNLAQLQNHTIRNHTIILSYGQRHEFLYNADTDLNNTDNVILMYSGESRYYEEYTSGSNSYSPQTFNTEHVYPQSLLTIEDAVTDLHHLRSCDANINELRSNFPFTTGSGDYQLIGENQWYPGDDWRGDVARMIFYVHIRYGETFEKVGNLDLFLEWNAADPVSEFENQRNLYIEVAQGVRNPFIDNPYLATLLWEGQPAENKW